MNTFDLRVTGNGLQFHVCTQKRSEKKEPVDLGQERARLNRELAEAESQIVRLEKLLASDFANKAPEAVVAKERGKLAAYKETAEKIRASEAIHNVPPFLCN
jgi:valyl-tRNA synthetase